MTSATYELSGFSETPREISELFGLHPDGSMLSANPNANSWWIFSDLITDDFNEHIRFLLERFEGKEHLLRAEWNPKLEMIWPRLSPPGGRVFQPDVIAMLARCKATLVIKA